MKKFSSLVEGCVTSDVNPGNALSNTIGVSNHYTPIQNILTNIKNIYCSSLGVVASIGEDGMSIKLNSSRFTSEKEISKVIYAQLFGNQSMASYIQSQGLDAMKSINVGQFYVVYFYPTDIANTTPGEESNTASAPCKEMLESYIYEAEMASLLINEDDDDEELEDLTKKQLIELINTKDKVKAAKQFGQIVAGSVELPNDYYFAGVKSKDGDESIALRWKYIKRRPHGKSSETTRSLINIYGSGDEAIWIGDFDKDAYFKIPDEVKKLIDTVLEILDAKETDDPCVWSIDGENGKSDKKDDKKDDDKKDDDKKDDEKSDDKTNNKDASDESDDEDDSSRGDDSDNLL